MDRKYVMAAFGYALLGMLLGIYMAASKNHGQLVAHAHILLLGFVTSFVYGVCYKLWLNKAAGALVKAQFAAHQVGTACLTGGLFLMYGGFVSEALLGPVLGVSSLLVLAGMVLMKVLFIRARSGEPQGLQASA